VTGKQPKRSGGGGRRADANHRTRRMSITSDCSTLQPTQFSHVGQCGFRVQ
jgi:hypothetical protein